MSRRSVQKPEPEAEAQHDEPDTIAARVESDPVRVDTAASTEPEEDEGLTPIPDRLLTELTAWRTLALRNALGEQPDVASLAALHALCIKVFYRYSIDSLP